MTMRPCIETRCPALTQATRCSAHARAYDRTRQARRGSLYNAEHQRRARACIAAQPWCTDCGRRDDLTADHVLPGEPASPLRTRCRSCNSARANRGRVAR